MNWLDSWDDWFNPITVLKLHSATRQFDNEILILSFLSLIIIIETIMLYGLKIRPDLSSEECALTFSIIPIFFSICCVMIGFTSAISALVTRSDEDLGLVPLSPQQQVHGYLAYSCIMSIFFNSVLLPFIAVGHIIGSVPYVLLLVPFGSFFLSQIVNLICLSFFARIKRDGDFIILFTTIIFYFEVLIVAWSSVIYCASSCWQPLVWNQGFGFVSLFILLPIALLLLGYIAYKLAIYGFKTQRKPFWRALLLNIVIYTLFNIIVAALWLGLAALVL
jgi:hypothetical protein